MPRPTPGVINIQQRPVVNLENRNPIGSNQLYTPAIVAPINLSPSSNLEVPIKDYNRNFASSGFQNGFNNQYFGGQTNANFDYPNFYYVQRN